MEPATDLTIFGDLAVRATDPFSDCFLQAIGVIRATGGKAFLNLGTGGLDPKITTGGANSLRRLVLKGTHLRQLP